MSTEQTIKTLRKCRKELLKQLRACEGAIRLLRDSLNSTKEEHMSTKREILLNRKTQLQAQLRACEAALKNPDEPDWDALEDVDSVDSLAEWLREQTPEAFAVIADLVRSAREQNP